MNNDILNKVIVIGGDHYNTLWTVRSLGIKHIRPEVIIFSDASKSFVQKTKYASSSKIFSQKEQIVDYLLSTYSSTEVKPVIITCADNIAAFLDMQYEHLSKFFYLHRTKLPLLAYEFQTVASGIKFYFLIPTLRHQFQIKNRGFKFMCYSRLFQI